MVIHHFNRVIHNKWIWGTFAVAISIFFAFDFLIVGNDNSAKEGPSVGKLAGEKVGVKAFDQIANNIRKSNRAGEMAPYEVNHKVWETLAAFKTAENLGITVSDEDVRAAIMATRQFQGEDGQFDSRVYQYLLMQNGFNPETYERNVRNQIVMQKLYGFLEKSTSWVAPLELESAIDDYTDLFTIRVAEFNNKAPKNEKPTEAQYLKYYNDNTNSLALPDCASIRYVKYSVNKPELLSKIPVSDEECHDHYDAFSSQYVKADTNGNYEVWDNLGTNIKARVKHDLQIVEAVEIMRTNLLARVYPDDGAAPAKDMLDKIAAADKQKILTSKTFAMTGRAIADFAVDASTVLPGVKDFLMIVADLDPDDDMARYGVLTGSDSVYLVERASFEAAHLPSIAVCKTKKSFENKVVAMVRENAFADSVKKAREVAVKVVAAGKPFDKKFLPTANVSTSMTFTVSGKDSSGIKDFYTIIGAAPKLVKGEVSDALKAGTDRMLLVYVENRVRGNMADRNQAKAEVRDGVARMAQYGFVPAWQEANLDKLGYAPIASASDKKEEDVAEEDDDAPVPEDK